jgi:hypothetical protein
VVEFVDQTVKVFRRVGYHKIKRTTQRRSDVTKVATAWLDEEEQYKASYKRARTWETRDGERWFGDKRRISLM